MSRPDLDMAAKIWRSALPPGVNKLVLQCFVHHLNAREGAAYFGLSWPSVSRVARMCGISERTVQGHIRALERAGILRARLRTGRTTRYSIHTDTLAPLVFSTDTVVLDALAPTPAVFAEKPAANATQAAENDTKLVEICTLTGDRSSKNAAVTAAPALPDALLLAEGVPPQVLADFAAIRAKKKLGALNATALDALRSEAAIAGLTLVQVLTLCCTRNWGRFEAAWLTDTRRNPASSASANPANITTPAPPAGPPPQPPKRAAPEVVAAGRQRLQEIRKTMHGIPALPAMPTGASEIRIAPDAPGWAVAIVNKQRTGQHVNRTALDNACSVLKIDPVSLRRAVPHDARTVRKPNPAGLAVGRMH
jgi:DNA-binding transcriptional ArsR family regulator